MIGKLQTNKVKYVMNFDYIHSVDNYKLAKNFRGRKSERN